jgi:preprotein translocase subunit SecF
MLEFLKPGSSIDFIGKRRLFAALSALTVLISLALFVFVGPKWGIDFTGGTEVKLRFTEDVEVGEIRGALETLGVSGDSVQAVGGDEHHDFVVRIQDPAFGTAQLEADAKEALGKAFGPTWIKESRFDAELGARLTVVYNGEPVQPQAVEAALATLGGAAVQTAPDDNTLYIKLPGLANEIQKVISGSLQGKDFTVVQVDSVGPKVGGDLRKQGIISIFATLGLILIYVAFRFDLAYAPGAVLCLFHDVMITVGVFILIGKEFNVSMIGALLTIIGYSLNDTIVIYDRIRENQRKYRRRDTATLINTSINETLGRTLATSGTTLVAILAFLFMGGPVIEDFALAITLGIAFGSYSTIYVASPSILVFEDLKPWLSKVFLPLAPKVAPTPEGGGTSEDKS